MKDLMGALRTLLLSRASVTALTSSVFINRLPRSVIEDADTYHPPKMLVIRQAGGAGKADLLVTDEPTINVISYGETGEEADKLRRVVWAEFVNLAREKQDDVLLYHVNPTSGPTPLVDPDIVWPAVSQSFSVLAAVRETN